MSESADPKIGFAWKHPALILGQEHRNEGRPRGTHVRDLNPTAPCRCVDVWRVMMMASFAVTIFD